MITGLDHIALFVRDLDLAVADYTALLGRAPNWRGAVHGARHAWFQLPNMALDVIAGEGTSAQAGDTRAQIEKYGEGIWGMGFAVADLDAACRTLERRGVMLTPVGVTHSEGADGASREWRIAMARRKSANGLVQFFVEQQPDAPRWPVSPLTASEDTAVAGLDHVVVNTANPDRALAHYGARLGLDLRLDRSNEQWGSRLLFFRCGSLVVEIGAILKAPQSDAPDRFGGLAWRVRNAAALRERLAGQGFDVSELRKGRKPGTSVFTVRSRTTGVPTLMLETSAPEA